MNISHQFLYHLVPPAAWGRTGLRRTAILLSSVCGLLFISTEAHGSVYVFDALSNGALAGQDGWTIAQGSSLVVGTGSGVDTTQIATAPGGVNIMTRPNDGNFSYSTITGLETSLTIQADFRFSTAGGGNPNEFAFNLSGVGAGASPWIGYEAGKGIYLRDANGGADHYQLVAGMDNNDWVRLMMVLDLTANAGDGSASVFYQNLTDGNTGFTAVSGLQNVDVNILTNGAIPTGWNAIRLDGRDGSSTVGGIDNLLVSVPEPSRALLLLGGLMGVAMRRRRRS